MSELIRTFTITVGKVYNGEQECRHPKVELVDNEGAAVSCINLRKGIYRVQIGLESIPSLTFSVKCEDAVCDKCEEKTIVKRFCDSVNGCDAGDYCDSDGFCASIFSEFYTGGTEEGRADSGRNRCNDQHPCPGNKQCKNGRCECPIGTIENGDWCSDCDNADDCGICETCESVGNYSVCRQKDCNCNSVGDCVECINSGHCDANEVCEDNECKCVGGAVRVNGVCTEIECEDDSECKDCEYCGGITCLPIKCPIGKSPQIVNGICSCVDDDGTDGQEPSSSPSPPPSDPDDPCSNIYCVTAFDCDFGCGCDKGICSSCSNYEVEDCVVSGCTVFAGSCVGDPNGPTNPETDCTDSTTITKDDSNCTITGTVTKSSCCSCSPLTIDALVSKVRPSGSNKKLDFTVELRKGVFLSDSPFANPLVDNYGHPNIAENEPPISGTVSLSVVTQYDIYSPSGSYLGVSSDPETVYIQPISGTSKAVFNEVFIYTPGFAVSSEKVVKKTTVEVRHSGQFVFENECKYASGSTVGSFVFDSSADFTINVPPVGTTIQSSNCRKPLFKWTKSADTDFNENPFRKTYAPEVDGEFKDIITYAEGAESCYYYKLESDCNCEEPTSLFIVFCNPDTFPKPTLSNCNKTADITIYPTCEANYDKDYELYINNVKVQTLRLNTTFSKEYTSESPITNITLKLKCDIVGECDVEHVFDEEILESDPDIECNSDGTYTATWDSENLTKVQWGLSSTLGTEVIAASGVVSIPDLESGITYYYKASFTGGCSAEGVFSQICPAGIIPTFDCNSDGTYTISNLDEDGTYTLTDYV